MRTRLSILTAVPVAALVLLSLAACVPTSSAEPESEPTPTPTASPTPSSTPTPTATAPVGIPVTVSCDQLMSAQVLSDYGYSLVADYKAAAGSLGAQAIAEQGIACAWTNASTNARIEGSVAHLPDADLTALKNDLVMTSHSVPTYQVEGYFTVEVGSGTAQAFPDPYWVTLSSPVFREPGDAQPWMASAVAALG